MKKIFNILVFIFFGFNANAQSLSEIGLPYIHNYSPDDYDAFDQNWGATQDSLGIMYFANGDGVLSYNGVKWDLIQLPNKATVFALAKGKKGEIYVGAIDEFGYLEANNIGQLTYISLLQRLPKNLQDFGEIRTICSTKEGVFFNSKKYIFKWDGTKFESWENSGDSYMFSVNNTILKRFKGKGLMAFKNDQFELVAKGELFANRKIYSILQFNDNEFLIVTRNKLFVFDGKKYEDFKTNTPRFFEDNIIYTGVALNKDTFALGSLNKGLLIFDSGGRKNSILSENDVLRSNGVLGLYKDRSGLLWASLNSGIAKIEYPSPFTFFNKYNNAPNLIFAFQRYHEKLFIGGLEGLFYLDNNKHSDNNLFAQIEGDFGGVWDLILFKDKMLIGSNFGVFEVGKNKKPKKLVDLKVSSLYQSKIDSNRIFIASESGLYSMYFKNGKWELEHKFQGVNTFVDKIEEKSNGDLWLSLDLNELISITFNTINDAENLIKPKVRKFTPKDGLPDNIGKPYIIEDTIYFSSDSEVYKFDSESQRFFNDKKLFIKLGVEDKKVKINFIDNKNRIWLIEYEGEKRIDQLMAVQEKDGTYNLNSLNEERIIELRKFGLYAELEDSIIWYKGKQGVVRHDLKINPYKAGAVSNTLISNITIKNDSIIYGGYESNMTPRIPFKNNQLRFNYASTNFYDESKNEYQYMLAGFDENWSSWSLETQKDYTNIPEGDYHFKVRSKNIFNHIGEDDSYSFTVLPPWYRTWWMYLLYGLGTIALLSLILQWRSKELRRKNENLENLVAERTTEIHHKNELLMHQTEKLVQIDEAKTELYANITHEFRTPLTVILGMADTLKSNVKNNHFKDTDKSLEMIRRNGKNLLQLVNEMLDLAKVESGSLDLNLVQTDAIPFVKYLSESFHSLAESKKINLTVYSEIDTLEMDIDVNKMASIVSNLLSNAIKFTSANGKIFVHLNKIQTKDDEFLSIKFKDTGLGLTENDITHLFDRFYQVDDVSSQKRSGTGIGLSLAKEFVELMNGTIDVESTLGKGSTFTVQIPITNNAVKTVDAKITVEPPIKKTSNSTKTESTVLDEASVLPLALIVEDNEDVAHYLKACLKGKYQTIHAINGNLGIDMAYEKIPDIIISDVMMPGKDGFEVCAALKSDERTDHIPIILLTAKVTTEDRLTGLAHGADAYLAKPFNEKELFIRLDQLVLVRKKLIDKIKKEGFIKFLNNRAENPETKFLQKVIKLVNEEISNATFGASDLASKLHLSESQVYKKLKAITDKSTAVFIRSIRLQKAKELLQTTNKTISEIAYEVGFNDPSWFSRAFKEEFGFAPSDFLK